MSGIGDQMKYQVRRKRDEMAAENRDNRQDMRNKRYWEKRYKNWCKWDVKWYVLGNGMKQRWEEI